MLIFDWRTSTDLFTHACVILMVDMMRKLWLVFALIMLFSAATPAYAQVPAVPAPAARRVDTDPYSLINAVNELRAANGLAPYTINSILMTVAQQHAQYMAANGVSHSGPGGTTPWQRGLAAGYPLAGDLSLGGFYSENITAGAGKSVQDAVTEWQGDAPHLNTMLAGSLHEIGAGVAIVGDYVYYVIDCAQPTSGGQLPAYTPSGSTTGRETPAAGPLVVNTIVPVTPQPDGRLVHVVKPGETLWLIAVSYGLKIVDVRRLNNIAEGQSIFPGEKILLGQAPTATLAPPTLTATALPSSTAIPSSTPGPLPPSATPTPLPMAPISTASSMLVLGVIVVAALVLAAVLVRAGRKD